MTELTSFDKALLNQLQGNLPVCSRPFAALAEQLGTEEQVVIDRLNFLKQEGICAGSAPSSIPTGWATRGLS